MAAYNATTDMTLEAAILAGSMIDGETLDISNGAVVTCTETPSILIGHLDINDGEFKIDGKNISAGNSIAFVGEWGHQITAYGVGTVTVDGDWYSIGTTDGTDNQTFDLASYYNTSKFVDCVPMIQVETGRRLIFDAGVGLTPAVDDFVFKTSDLNVFGQIIEVQPTYIVVGWLTGSVADNDSIEIRKVVDNVGPDFQISWTATINNALGDIKEAGIYQEFGNSVENGVSYKGDFSHHAGGFVFDQFFQTTTITMGTSLGPTGGFVPPNGCDVRLPNIYIASASVASYSLEDTYWIGTNANSAYNLSTGNAGAVDFNVCNIGSAFMHCLNPRSIHGKYVGFVQTFGAKTPGSYATFTHCTAITSPFALTGSPSELAFYLDNIINGASVTNCLCIGKGPLLTIGASSAFDITIRNNIVSEIEGNSQSNTIVCYSFETCTDTLLENNINYLGAFPQADQALLFNLCNDITVKNHLSANSQAIGAGESASGTLSFNTSNTIYLEGAQILHEAVNDTEMIRFLDANNVKVRAIGLIDDPIDMGIDGAEMIDLAGICNNVDMARCHKTGGIPLSLMILSNTSKNITLTNCSGDYDGEVELDGINMQLKGYRGGSGSIGNIKGIENDLAAVYGNGMFDIFRSDTTGAIALVLTPSSPESSHYTILAGSPRFFTDGDLDMLPGDIIEYEMQYSALGHLTFTGTFSAAVGTGSEGSDEWGNIDIDLQYDVGAGWNGVWLDLKTPANLTGITGMVDGVKLKVKLTCVTARTNMTVLSIDTTTTIQAQKDNLYPIDQSSVNLKFTVKDQAGLAVSGALVYIDDNNTAPYLFQGITDVNGEASVDYTGASITNSVWRVRKYGYKNSPASLDIFSSDINLPVTLVADPQQV